MQPDRYGTISSSSQSRTIDQGLRDHMNSIYGRMTLGILVTALVAFGVSSSEQLLNMIFGSPFKWVVIFAPLAIVFFGFNPARMSANALRLSFIALSVCYGLSFGALFAMYSAESIAKAFFVTAAGFAGLSLYGYTTKRDLTGFGKFLMIGMFGLLAMVILNLFVQSSMLMNIISVVMLLVFAGMTVWETQRMKEMYHPSYGADANSRMAWMGALNLYISFIAIFQVVLNFMGSRE